MTNLLTSLHLRRTISTLRKGGVIAYPTEAVYGFGCDPLHKEAVLRLSDIKQRSLEKGLILIAANWEQVQSYVQQLSPEQLQQVHAATPKPVTWVFPASPLVPEWIRGIHESVAVRITNHPLAKALCLQYGTPIVSTSANLSGEAPLIELAQVRKQFAKTIDYILPGRVGELKKPTEIRDVRTGKVFREG